MWWLAIAAGTGLGGVITGLMVRRRLLALLAVERDRSARRVDSARAEVALFRTRHVGQLAVQAAAEVVDAALLGMDARGER
ncbi:MAG: hypothetical protein HOY79_34265 [Streptomyces sp.]|nr:hypothetical protein [Streptomyces sp.]NUS11377.1 hypothetical protein [Streptomyces sp.]NUS23482.1 hypothetical protein [Streptomyces sp.]